MSIRVLHLIGGGEIGGAEQNVLNLLQGFDRNSVEPALVCLVNNSPFASLAQTEGIETKVFPTNFPQGFYALLSLLRYCRKNNIELLHCHGTRANFLGRIAARRLSIPCVSTIHSELENDSPSDLKASLAILMDKITLPWASGLITVSNNLRKSIVARTDRKDSSLPIKTIYNGCALLDFSNREELRSAFRKKLDVSDNCTVIGTIGRLHPVKGQIYLVEALKLLAKEFPDLHLLMIGEGRIPELLTDNSEALLVDPADPVELTLACSRILRDHNLSSSLIENARQKVSSFTIEKMVDETVTFYQQVIKTFSSVL
jgi:glycosyltransferase involved in cell wall biosynthesis